LLQSDGPRHDLPRQREGEGAVLLFAFSDDLEQLFETGTESYRLCTSKTSIRRKRASRPAGTRLITVEGVAVGGAFDRHTATGMMPVAHCVARRASVRAIVIYRQEVRPMNAVSAVGAPLQSTIARLR
jgi:hypothetical protein